MRGRLTPHDEVSDAARRRLAQLSAELSALREPSPDAETGAVVPSDGEADETWTSDPVPLPVPGRHARRAGRATGLLPSTFRGRVALRPAHLAWVALTIAAALAITAWSVLGSDRGEVVAPAGLVAPAPTPLVTPAAEPTGVADPVPAATSSTKPGAATVVVDVAGKVRRPGIVTLPAGARVVDAVEEAGGARRGVPLTSLNLARLLVDGEQILVGVPAVGGVAAPAAGAATATTTPGGLVSINSATLAELDTLPGIGPVTAQAILDWRTEHGAFSSVDELLEVSGIGDVTLAEIAPLVTL